MMPRRIFASVFMFSILLIASFLFSHQNVLALTPTVSATPTAAPADFIGTPLSGTAPLTVQFTDVSHILITACTWNYGDGIGLTVDPTGTPFTACPSLPHTYTSAGSFTVTMRLFKTDGTSATVTKTNYVHVANPPLTPTRAFTPTSTPAGDFGLITITGNVRDVYGSTQICCESTVGASISVSTSGPHGSSGGTATTDANGNYTVSNIHLYDTDTVTVTVTATGLPTTSMQRSGVATSTNKVFNFTLVPVTPTPWITNTLGPTFTPTRTPTGPTPTRTRTPTVTPFSTACDTPGSCITGTPVTPTRTITPTPVITNTPTSGGACSPVSSSITAPFTFDGAGTFCWQSTNLGAYTNSWNTTSVTLNGVNITNVYVAAASYPAKIGGYWYVGYSSSVAWGHFEAK